MFECNEVIHIWEGALLLILQNIIYSQTTMENINLSAYYEKISSIRAKILTKHREQPSQVSQKYLKEDRSATNTLPSNHINAVQSYQARTPLQTKASNQQNINLRLKQLDSVNDKIKLILSNKRQPSVNIVKGATPVVTSNDNLHPAGRKLTSLFQNQNKIVESKVGPSMNNFLSIRQKGIEQRSLRSNSIKNTVQSRLCTNEDNQLQRTNEDKSHKYLFQSNKDQKRTKPQQKSLTADINFADSYHKSFHTSFARHNRQSFQVQEHNSQNYHKYIPSLQQPISISGFFAKAETKKLVQLLSNQIILDKKLREAKEQFDNLKIQNKWGKLKEQLSTYCLQLNDEDFQNWLTLSPQESNPFSQKIPISNFSFQQLGECFVYAWRHWSQKLKESVEITKLEEQGFKIQQIDLGEKGYITIEDLVCFINMNSDGSLRNRDIFCFFKRLNAPSKSERVENRLSYETFLNFVAK